ncbi:MAG: tetratricopeptide repeat protein [Desulfohalobiaceae bacterium]
MRTVRLVSCWILVFLAVSLLGCAASTGKRSEQATPGEVQARIELAESYLASNDYRNSLKELLEIEEQSGNNPRFLYDLGITYVGLREYERAAQALERAVDLEPDYGPAWNLLGQAHIAQGNVEPAIDAFERSMGIMTYLTPEYPAYNLAKLYQSRGEQDKAIAHARMALDKNWRYTPAYLLLADLLLEQGRTGEAIEVLTRGAEANPKSTEIILRLAENQLRQGNTAEARNWFQHIIMLDPESDAAEVAEDYLDLMR